MMKIRRDRDSLGIETIKALIAALMISLILFTITSRQETESDGFAGIEPIDLEKTVFEGGTIKAWEAEDERI